MKHKLARKLIAVRSFPRQFWPKLIEAWILLLVVELGLRILTFKRLHHLLLKVPLAKHTSPLEEEAVRQTNKMVVLAANNHIFPMTCLRQSLVLQWMLRRRGIDSDVRIGVKKTGDQFSAHAWVEWQGKPLDPSAVHEFAPLSLTMDNK